MERCLTKDQLLQAPQEGLEFPSYGQQTPPFTLQGRFYTSLPQTLTGGVVYIRKQNAVGDTSNFASYFARDNYQEIRLSGENVLPADPNSTLRFNQKTFTLKFALLHRPIWSTNNLQVSLFFESDSRTFFHICIPVVIGGDQKSENLFLASWLGRKPIPPSGLSLNELLNFRGTESDVRFSTLEFCLKYNVRVQANGQEIFDLRPYTFCIFKNPISILPQTCPDWLRNQPNMDGSPVLLRDIAATSIPAAWRIRNFNEFFNYTYRLMKPVLNQSDPFVISAEEHFDNERTQNVVKPAFFKTTSAVLLGRPLSGKQVKEGNRGLQNVKCYPIDLVNQVDEGGNIYIDQESNKPINVKDAMILSKTGGLPDELDGSEALDETLKAAEQASKVRFWIAFAVIMLILLAFLVTLIVFVFRGSSFSKTEFVPANTPAMANAAVNTAVNAANASVNAAVNAASNAATVATSVRS